jgi:hypothetical protein
MTHRPTGPKSNIVIVFENVLNKNSRSSLTTSAEAQSQTLIDNAKSDVS